MSGVDYLHRAHDTDHCDVVLLAEGLRRGGNLDSRLILLDQLMGSCETEEFPPLVLRFHHAIRHHREPVARLQRGSVMHHWGNSADSVIPSGRPPAIATSVPFTELTGPWRFHCATDGF